MPHVVLVLIAGAGVYAGMRWVAKALSHVEDAAQSMQDDAETVRAPSRTPKDLGTLDYDNEAKVYRPRKT